MSTIKVKVQLFSEELLKAVEQLSLPDLEQFVSQVICYPISLGQVTGGLKKAVT
jgi:hypothetical protein